MQCSAVQCSAVQCSSVMCCDVQFCAVQLHCGASALQLPGVEVGAVNADRDEISDQPGGLWGIVTTEFRCPSISRRYSCH